jgi:hypothetical protein
MNEITHIDSEGFESATKYLCNADSYYTGLATAKLLLQHLALAIETEGTTVETDVLHTACRTIERVERIIAVQKRSAEVIATITDPAAALATVEHLATAIEVVEPSDDDGADVRCDGCTNPGCTGDCHDEPLADGPVGVGSQSPSHLFKATSFTTQPGCAVLVESKEMVIA